MLARKGAIMTYLFKKSAAKCTVFSLECASNRHEIALKLSRTESSSPVIPALIPNNASNIDKLKEPYVLPARFQSPLDTSRGNHVY